MKTGQDLPSMETYFGLPGDQKTIPVRRSDSVLEKSLFNLNSILEKMFQPVSDHIETLGTMEQYIAFCKLRCSYKLGKIRLENSFYSKSSL